jgi:PAS domain S-box-containing protein
LVVERMGALERMSVGQALPVRDFQVQSIQGQRLSVQATAVRVDTPSGPANLSIYVDITARKAAEAALQRSEALLSHLFATSADCISLSEAATGRFAMVNPAYTQVLGYAGDQIIGRTSLELGLWQDPNDRQRLLAQLERDGHATDFRCTMVARSGAPVTMVLAVGRFMMDGREYLVINSRDVTQSERTRQQHAAILERASIGIAFTQDQRFVQVNPHFERMFGWTAQELVGQPGIKVWPSAAEYEEVGRQAGPLLASGRPYRMERRMRRRDGSEFWCRATAQALDRADPSRSGTIWITEDVSERRRFDEALASALEAAQAANRAKGNFLANTSHEIRTPLNGLLGLARLAMQEGLSESRRQSCLAQILDSAQSLADILSDILDLSKIESGKFSLDPQPFDLRELLGVLHKAYGALAEVKGLTLRLEIDAQLPSLVHGDAVRVRQILSNLLNNALKFTDHGHITLRAAPVAARGLRLTVTDTGPGVPAPLQSQLFTPFSQGDSSTTRRHGGTGLGLSICRELAELMGGRVGLDSTPGVGSSFWAELPLAPAVALPARVDTEALDRVPLRGARVLLAEDNPVNMMIGVALLEDWGVQVTQAADGRSAVDQVLAAARAGRAFDAVLMDVQMPLMSGHEAARELRADPLAATLPIVALTAAALVSERDEALAAGMNAFLTKPIDANQLRQTLARQLADRAA